MKRVLIEESHLKEDHTSSLLVGIHLAYVQCLASYKNEKLKVWSYQATRKNLEAL